MAVGFDVSQQVLRARICQCRFEFGRARLVDVLHAENVRVGKFRHKCGEIKSARRESIDSCTYCRVVEAQIDLDDCRGRIASGRLDLLREICCGSGNERMEQAAAFVHDEFGCRAS